MSVPVAVFASGGGTNFQSLLDHQTPEGDWEIRLLISDRAEAGALERAAKYGAEARVIPVKGRPTGDVARETLEVLEELGIQVVLLAGYLRLVPAEVVRAFRRRILNIHPALLPAFGGKGMWGRRVHEAVLASGASFSGPTIHYVDEEYDTGSILAQWPVPVLADDTPDSLAARVLKVEHILYPAAVDHLCRWIARDEPAPPFSLPGLGMAVREAFSPEETARQIQAGFGLGEAG